MAPALFTIGHSSHAWERFLELLRAHEIAALSDVRSVPYSRRNPQFNRETLSAALAVQEIRYTFLGRELGARSEDPDCYRGGRVSYERLAATELFRAGLARVRGDVEAFRVALMCAEGDPLRCHRTILVCRHLRSPALAIRHILPSGAIETHDEAEERLLRLTRRFQLGLFEDPDGAVERAYDLQGERIAYTRLAAPGRDRDGE